MESALNELAGEDFGFLVDGEMLLLLELLLIRPMVVG